MQQIREGVVMCMSNFPTTNRDRTETLGTGMARRAADTVNMRPQYMAYVADAQANGEAAMP